MNVELDLNKGPRLARRDLLCISVSGVGIALLPGQTAAGADDAQTDLIDAHVHVWTPDTKRYPLADGFKTADMRPPSFTRDELMAHAKPCGVTRVVLIQMSFYRYDNSYMLKTMQDHKGEFSGVAVVDENNDPAGEMKKLAKHSFWSFRKA